MSSRPLTYNMRQLLGKMVVVGGTEVCLDPLVEVLPRFPTEVGWNAKATDEEGHLKHLVELHEIELRGLVISKVGMEALCQAERIVDGEWQWA